MTEKKQVRVFSTPTCPYCIKTKKFLDEKGVKHKDLNVAEDDKALNEMIEKTGQQGVPVIDIDGEFVIGYDKEKIEELLKKKGYLK